MIVLSVPAPDAHIVGGLVSVFPMQLPVLSIRCRYSSWISDGKLASPVRTFILHDTDASWDESVNFFYQ